MQPNDRKPAAVGAAGRVNIEPVEHLFGITSAKLAQGEARIELRPYQAEAIARVRAEVKRGNRRVLLVAPTGAGKTVLAAAMIGEAVAAGHQVLFLAHRRELIQQAAAKLFDAGIDAGIIQAGHHARPDVSVQIASVQTLHARAIRGRKLEMPAADLLIVDEAHHVVARTYLDIVAAYPDSIVVGLTATPIRADGMGLGNCFNVLVEAASVAKLTAAGFLVPARIYAPTRPDLSGVHVKAGDYVKDELAAAMDKQQLTGDIVGHYLSIARGRQTAVFASGVAHSIHLRDEFRRLGIMSEHIDGTTPSDERDAILRGLARGSVEVVMNAMVLTEGWDCPEVSALVLARPTRSLALYRQMIGRALRPAPGKSDAIILDHSGAVFEHGFPDDSIEWSLSTDHRAINRSHNARKQQTRGEGLSTCPECHAIRMPGKPCGSCGWRARPRGADVEVVEGVLAEVGPDRVARKQADPSVDEQRRWHAGLAHIAAERGYKPGWAAVAFKDKFGKYPADRHVKPAAPDEIMRRWEHHRRIAFAKSQAGAR